MENPSVDSLDTLLASDPHLPPDEWMDTFVQCVAYDTGYARGLAFRLAELQAEYLEWYDNRMAARSPCGIHLYPAPVPTCGRCWP